MASWQRLPALRTLRIFEAAARHLNYTRAAQELHLTHGAISHQMQALEERLGVRLIERDGRQARLTAAGEQLAEGVRGALDTLASTVERVRQRDDDRQLTISVLPSFAAAWLVGRLGQFLELHPEIDLTLQSNSALANFREDGVTVAIRYGAGQWPNLVAELLLEDEAFPVVSTEFNRGRKLNHPGELAKLPLLRMKFQPWAPWFAAAGVDLPEPKRGPLFDDAELILQAAMRGQGVALGRTSLVAGKLASGALIAPFPQRVRATYAYYLVYPQAHAGHRGLLAFRHWIQQEVVAIRAAIAAHK